MREDVGDQEVDVLGGVGGAASVFVLHYVDGKAVSVERPRNGDALYPFGSLSLSQGRL